MEVTPATEHMTMDEPFSAYTPLGYTKVIGCMAYICV